MRQFVPFAKLSDYFKERIKVDYVVNGQRWVGRRGLLVATDGESAMIENEPGSMEWLMSFWKVTNPLVKLTSGDIDDLVQCDERCVPGLKHRHMPMGALGIELSASSWATVVVAFGHDVEWWGSGPYDIVVAKKAGDVVAIVGAVKPLGEGAYERGLAEAEALLAKRNSTNASAVDSASLGQ